MNDSKKPQTPDSTDTTHERPSSWPLQRGLDAGLNRLSEALRVVEDRLRFDLQLPAWAGQCKGLRQQQLALRRAIEETCGPLALARDSAGDPGHPGRSEHDPVRDSLSDLVVANLQRGREASRSIEEAVRLVAPQHAAAAAALRYEIYQLDGVMQGFLARNERLAQARLYVLLTSALAARDAVDTARATIAGGAQVLQLREKHMEGAEFLRLAEQLRTLTADHGVLLIINDRVDVAALAHADGVHQGQGDFSPAQVRRILGGHAIVGVSTHNPDQAAAAQRLGADYIGVGPIFATQTKEHRGAVGPEYIAAARAATDLPGFAIGSVKRESLGQVIEAGARRVAVCTGIIASDDIEGTTRWFRDRLDALDE